MTQIEILEQLKQLTTPERLTIIEAAVQLIREDLQREEQPPVWPEGKRQPAVVAEAPALYYTWHDELTLETTGTIDAQQRILLDEPLPVAGPTRVRVIILLPEKAEIDEREWLRVAAANPAFAFLKEPVEDIYTLADGRPFHDQG